MGYCKLFSTVTQSSLWSESYPTRLLFISMLAAADAEGFVEASVSGLARLGNITIEEARGAIAALEGPDVDSKDTEYEGRRIVKVEGGWVILNYVKYRTRKDEESRKRYIREYMRKYRSKEKTEVDSGKQDVNEKGLRKPQAEGEEEADAEVKRERGRSAPHTHESLELKLEQERIAGKGQLKVSDDDLYIQLLEREPAYAHLNVRHEWGKMSAWCRANGKVPGRKRFVNWLNRCDQPMKVNIQPAAPTSEIQRRISELENQTKLAWQRQAYPELVKELSELRKQIGEPKQIAA